MNNISSNRDRPKRLGRSLPRSTRLVVIGGMAAGSGFAGVTAIASASTNSPSTGSTVAPSINGPGGASAAPGGPGRPGPGRGHRGGPDGPMGGRGGRGRGGTITAINGTTLTLRTMNGTETVDTSSSTTYTKERRTIGLSDLSVGDVVHVRKAPRSSGTSASSSSSAPTRPGTGTLDASRIAVVEPSLVGRVTSASNGTYTLVGKDGQLLTVSTTSSTRYYSGPSQTTSSAIPDGAHIRAEGLQDSLTHLTADVVTVAPDPPMPGQARSSAPPVPGAATTG